MARYDYNFLRSLNKPEYLDIDADTKTFFKELFQKSIKDAKQSHKNYGGGGGGGGGHGGGGGGHGGFNGNMNGGGGGGHNGGGGGGNWNKNRNNGTFVRKNHNEVAIEEEKGEKRQTTEEGNDKKIATIVGEGEVEGEVGTVYASTTPTTSTLVVDAGVIPAVADDINGDWKVRKSVSKSNGGSGGGNVNLNKELVQDYPNLHNIYFYPNSIRPKVLINNDPELLKKIRSIMSKMTEATYEKVITDLDKLLKENQIVSWHDIGEMIYIRMIDDVFLVELYIKMLLRLEKNFSMLMKEIHYLIQKQLAFPRIFTTDGFSETALEKIKRYKVSNGIYLTHLYLQKKYSPLVFKGCLNYLLDNITPADTDNLEVILKVQKLIKKKDVSARILAKIEGIATNKEYPSRIRFLLKIPE